MPLNDLQRRAAEVGRIRLGERIDLGNGRSRPAKLETFRFTSPDQFKLRILAERFGGEVIPWQDNNGQPAWSVTTMATEIPIRIPPGEPISQWYEMNQGRKTMRRCDSEKEQFSSGPCLCPADKEDRQEQAGFDPPRACKPTTRLTVWLADVPGLGSWVMVTRGYAAAAELAGVADVLHEAALQNLMLPAVLRISVRETNNASSENKKRYVVPVIDVAASLAQLQAGYVPQPTLELQPQPIAAIAAPQVHAAPRELPPTIPPPNADPDAVRDSRPSQPHVIDAEIIEDERQQAAQDIADQLGTCDDRTRISLESDAADRSMMRVKVRLPEALDPQRREIELGKVFEVLADRRRG